MKRTLIKIKLYLVKGEDVGIRDTCKGHGQQVYLYDDEGKGFFEYKQENKVYMRTVLRQILYLCIHYND